MEKTPRPVMIITLLSWGIAAAFLRLAWEQVKPATRRRRVPSSLMRRPASMDTQMRDDHMREYIARAHDDDFYNLQVIVARAIRTDELPTN